MVYVIQVCWQLGSRIRAEMVWFCCRISTELVWYCCSKTKPFPSWSCSQAVSKPVWHIPLLCVQWKTRSDGQRNCPKHVEFYSKNKFEKLETRKKKVMILNKYSQTFPANTRIASPESSVWSVSRKLEFHYQKCDQQVHLQICRFIVLYTAWPSWSWSVKDKLHRTSK